MAPTSAPQMADHVARILEDRLRIRGTGLAEKLQNGGRRVPAKLRSAAARLVHFAEMAQTPRLVPQIDPAALAEAYDTCLAHLGGIGQKDRRRAALSRFGTSVLISVAAAVAVFVAVLVWRGFL